MADKVILLSIPGLRMKDLEWMPNLRRLAGEGDAASLAPSFPCVTLPVQANMTTGATPDQHGVVANGYYWRDSREVEMWTAWNDKVLRPQIWDLLHEYDRSITSAVWFPMFAKGCGADYICTPAPIHNPDGSESLWCYTKPAEFYGELRDALGHFPLQHFWGPMANVSSSQWIADSAALAARKWLPDFFYIYLPHLDYAAQKTGPDSEPALAAVAALDALLGKLLADMAAAYAGAEPLWIVASEYTIAPVDHVLYPNRVLREAGLLEVSDGDDGERLDLERSAAWALVDHQFSHVFVRDADEAVTRRVVELFRARDGVDDALAGDQRGRYDMIHERSGEVILVSSPRSWQAYYWWLDDARAPGFARTVDIHQKPGYDPCEMHFDPATKGITLDATRVRGSHGAPAREPAQRGLIVASQPGVLVGRTLADTAVCDVVLRQYGV